MLALSSPCLPPAPSDPSTTRMPEGFLVQNTRLICHLKYYKGSPPLHHKVQTPFTSAYKFPAFFSLSHRSAQLPTHRTHSTPGIRPATSQLPPCTGGWVSRRRLRPTSPQQPLETPPRHAPSTSEPPRSRTTWTSYASLGHATGYLPATQARGVAFPVSLPATCLNGYPRARREERRAVQGARSGPRLYGPGGRGSRRVLTFPFATALHLNLRLASARSRASCSSPAKVQCRF